MIAITLEQKSLLFFYYGQVDSVSIISLHNFVVTGYSQLLNERITYSKLII